MGNMIGQVHSVTLDQGPSGFIFTNVFFSETTGPIEADMEPLLEE